MDSTTEAVCYIRKPKDVFFLNMAHILITALKQSLNSTEAPSWQWLEYMQHIPFLGLRCPIFDIYIQPCPILLTSLKMLHYNSRINTSMNKKFSAKLTNQRVSHAFTSSPFNFHAHHILPTSKFQHSYCWILLIFYSHQWTACVRTVRVSTLHWFDASCSVTQVKTP